MAVAALICWLICWFVTALAGLYLVAVWLIQGLLAGIAVLGLTMFTRWIPVHAAFVAANRPRASRPASTSGRTGVALTVVIGHGVFAVAALTLVVLVMPEAGPS
jgi:manganese efflux pump family protein